MGSLAPQSENKFQKIDVDHNMINQNSIEVKMKNDLKIAAQESKARALKLHTSKQKEQEADLRMKQLIDSLKQQQKSNALLPKKQSKYSKNA